MGGVDKGRSDVVCSIAVGIVSKQSYEAVKIESEKKMKANKVSE